MLLHPLMRSRLFTFALTWLALSSLGTRMASAAERILDAQMHALRLGEQREWSDFPEQAEGPQLRVAFAAEPNAEPYTLRLRHSGLKAVWKLRLNGAEIGKLPEDECPMVTYWNVPAQSLRAGENVLLVESAARGPDDVWIGDVRLLDEARAAALSEAKLDVIVNDADTGQPVPARVTVVAEGNVLAGVGAESSKRLAVRPGVIYTADGRAEFGVRAGKYTIYAGRGFEYGIDCWQVELKPGESLAHSFTIRREAPMPGYVNCDTHVHTWTYSRHGDATLDERLVTLAGEGVELPISTDHNLQIDFEAAAKAAGVRRYFTPVVGNEVTTRFGHFNVFPLDPAAKVIDSRGENWQAIFSAIGPASSDKIVVLNHPRDVHADFRPFDPKRHISCSGEDLQDWSLAANAMEVVNSGTLQNDPWRLIHDWLGLLNAGLHITPIGSSDSHDVSRFIVGQGRTYIRAADRDAGAIDTREAVRNLAAGHAIVSFGLACDLTVDKKFGPGDTVVAGEELEIHARVFGPSWTRADTLVLFVNGFRAKQVAIPPQKSAEGPTGSAGLQFEKTWKWARPTQDVHLVAVALGPGVSELYWPSPRPYQSTSTEWRPYSLSVTGAVWVDADGAPGFTSAREYAARLANEANGDMSRLAELLKSYDPAVAIQAAALLRQRDLLFRFSHLETLLKHSNAATRQGIERYVGEWKASQAERRNNHSTWRVVE